MSTPLTAPDFAIVVAADSDNGIGKDGTLPWRLVREMAFFKRLTTQAAAGRRNAVFMGRKTYESIPAQFRPLSERINVVISRDASYSPQGAIAVPSFDDALRTPTKLDTLGQIFCVGGAEIYRIALQHPSCARVHLTRVHARFACDTHLPPLGARFELAARDGPHFENGVSYTFETHDRIVSAG